MAKDYKVLLVACAKDEAPYLPEWIYHHFRIGFAGIKIYVNNTTDRSVEILKDIEINYPISIVEADSLINSPPYHYKNYATPSFYERNKIQAICYIDAFLENDKDKYTHIAFLDVDEFFYPFSNLNDALSTKSISSIQQFQWFNLAGDNTEFSSLETTNSGAYDYYNKSIVPSNAEHLQVIDPHTFSSLGDSGVLNNSAIILHRVLRSKKEYLVILSRSSAEASDVLTNGFKGNRRGWTNRGNAKYPKIAAIMKDYRDGYTEFLKENKIANKLHEIRLERLEKHDKIVNTLNMMNSQNIELVRSLNGLDVKHVDLLKVVFHRIFWKCILYLYPSLILNHIELKQFLINKFKRSKR